MVISTFFSFNNYNKKMKCNLELLPLDKKLSCFKYNEFLDRLGGGVLVLVPSTPTTKGALGTSMSTTALVEEDLLITSYTVHVVRYISSIFLSNSEACASELLRNIEEMYRRCYY